MQIRDAFCRMGAGRYVTRTVPCETAFHFSGSRAHDLNFTTDQRAGARTAFTAFKSCVGIPLHSCGRAVLLLKNLFYHVKILIKHRASDVARRYL
jgi:hypothetical protein